VRAAILAELEDGLWAATGRRVGLGLLATGPLVGSSWLLVTVATWTWAGREPPAALGLVAGLVGLVDERLLACLLLHADAPGSKGPAGGLATPTSSWLEPGDPGSAGVALGPEHHRSARANRSATTAGGTPRSKSIEPDLVGPIVTLVGDRVGLPIWHAEEVFRLGVPVVGHGPGSSREAGRWPAGATELGPGAGRPEHGGVAGIPPLRCGRRGARAGVEPSRRRQRGETAPLARRLATCRRRSRYGSFGGDSGWCVPSGLCSARLVGAAIGRE
jgi:hypothetical protein